MVWGSGALALGGDLGSGQAPSVPSGPKPEMVYDFWRMVWQEHTPIIVMITNIEEMNEVGTPVPYKDQRLVSLLILTAVQ